MAENCCETSGACGCGCGSEVSRENKLCELTKASNQFDLKKIMPLVNNPKHLCRCCGRLANEKENLCNPTELVNN